MRALVRCSNLGCSKVVATEVGSATFAFTDAASGDFTYTLQGITQTKAISRQTPASRYSTCRTR